MSTLTLRSRVAQTLRARNAARQELTGMPLAAGSALVAMALAAPAGAQQAPAAPAGADTLGEIVVTGYRKSLVDALEVKRSADSIVEAISAEDIGKLPDSSIAESIARLPGLAGQRLDGRQNSISVRGFGEDFSATTFNGREQVSIGDNRGVSFDVYPAEIMAGVKVYKTSDATVIAQGIGGTIDLLTIKPLDAPKTLHFGADYERTSFDKLTAGGKDSGARGDFSYVDKFADGRLGVALAVAVLDSPNQEQRWNAWGYPTDAAGNFVLGGAKPFARSSELKRNTFMGVVEGAPNDSLKITADALFIKYDDQKILKGVEIPGAYNGASSYTEQQVENGFVTQATFTNRAGQVRNDFERETANLQSFGLNAKLDVSSTFVVTGDASYGKVSRDVFSLESYSGVGRPQCSGGVDTRTLDNIQYTLNAGNNGAVFTPQLNYNDPNLIKLGGTQCWGNNTTVPSNAQDGFINYPHIDDKLTSVRLSGLATLGGDFLKKVDFGVNYTERKKSKLDQGVFLTLPNYPGVAAVPAGFQESPTNLGFIGLGLVQAYDSYALYKSGYYKVTSENLTVTARAINTWDIDEKAATLYGKLDFGTNLGDVRMDGNLGLQVVNTDQSSNGFTATNDPVTNLVIKQPVSGGAKYNRVLPSLNLTFHLTEDQLLRAAVGRSMSRARMDRMNAGFGNSFSVANNLPGADLTKSPWSGNGANPGLRPELVDQYDLNYSWYFRKDGYVSAGAFYKRLTDWQIQQAVVTDFSGITPPGGVVATFNKGYVTTWVNGASGHVNGVELLASLPASALSTALTGLGVTASATYLNGWVNDPGANNQVPGLSRRVYNMTVYYESHGFGARLSSNSRSDFFGEVEGISFTPKPVQVKGGTIWDAQVSYSFAGADNQSLRGLTLTLQAQNLSNLPFVTYNYGDPRQVIDFQNYGRDYLAGFRYKF
jgi:iron complex outermembrane recepter protein